MCQLNLLNTLKQCLLDLQGFSDSKQGYMRGCGSSAGLPTQACQTCRIG